MWGRLRRFVGRRPARTAGVVLVAVLVLGGAVIASPAGASFLGFRNPAKNEPTPPRLSGPGSPCTPSGGDQWAACNRILLASTNRAQADERLPGIALPSNFLGLTRPQQLFVWVDLLRISHGVPPLVGLSPSLDAAASEALAQGREPAFQQRYGPVQVALDPTTHGDEWSAFEGEGSSMPMASGFVFMLMYQDGWGGPSFGPFGATMNTACRSPHAAGCWRDRDNLLGMSTGVGCTTCVAGAAERPGLGGSYALLLVHPVAPATSLAFTWDADVLPYLPPGYERVHVPS